MRKEEFSILPWKEHHAGIVEYLENSSFDEKLEIDLKKNRCRNIYHIEGKYFVPLLEASFTGLFSYSRVYMVHPDDRRTYEELLSPTTIRKRLDEAEPAGICSAQFRLKMLDGSWRWVEQVLVSGAHHGFSRDTVLSYIFDIQAQRNRRLGVPTTYTASANYHELTGLLKEKTFLLLARDMSMQNEAPWCMIAIDIEEFWLFNAWYGREMGDFMLANIGSMLKMEEIHYGGLACYQGEDDFCMLLTYDLARIARIYEQIMHMIRERTHLMGFLPSLGVCMVEEGVSIEETLNRAILAKSNLKGNFRTRIQMYNSSLMDDTQAEYRLLSDFQLGLQNDEFVFFLQPQSRMSSGKIVGAEALGRWQRMDGRIMQPAEFIPVLEKYGFITDFDRCIWEKVCRWMHEWSEKGHRLIPISVNVSQIDIFTIDVPGFFETLMQKYNLPRNMLKIEITESAYASDRVRADHTVQTLRKKGFAVLMDDFGSGYSSLNMLRRLEVDAIKLDGEFLQLEDEDRTKGMQILEATVNMIKMMGLPIIVEGVENSEQAEFLKNQGCRYAQGFYFYRPMDLKVFEALASDEQLLDFSGLVSKTNQQFQTREFMNQAVYNDTILNNILGAAAFYAWDGKESLDIIRYNAQFYRLVNVPDFMNRLTNIEQFFVPEDLERLWEMMKAAKEDRMNGASGVFGVFRTDGSVGQFHMQVFFLEQKGSRDVFYGALREVTQLSNLQEKLRLLAMNTSLSVVYARKQKDGWEYQELVHGLSGFLGLSADAFRRELNDGSFFSRMSVGDAERIRVFLDGGKTKSDPSAPEYGKEKVKEPAPHRKLELSVTLRLEGRAAEILVSVEEILNTENTAGYLFIFRVGSGCPERPGMDCRKEEKLPAP